MSGSKYQPVEAAARADGAHDIYAPGYAKHELSGNDVQLYELDGQGEPPVNEMPTHELRER